MKDLATPKQGGDVILGDDWVAPNKATPAELVGRRKRRNLMSLRRSPLARKIITFNLIALVVLIVGILYSNSTQNSLAVQRSVAIVNEAALVADVLALRLSAQGVTELGDAEKPFVADALAKMSLPNGAEAYVFASDGQTLAVETREFIAPTDNGQRVSETYLTDGLAKLWSLIAAPLTRIRGELQPIEEQLREEMIKASGGNGSFLSQLNGSNGTVFSAGTQINVDGQTIGIVALASGVGEIDRLGREEFERVLQMFLIATVVSIG